MKLVRIHECIDSGMFIMGSVIEYEPESDLWLLKTQRENIIIRYCPYCGVELK